MTAAPPENSLSIEVVADVICPWCFIGARRLDQALAALPGVRAAVVHRPFVLDPTTPPEGRDLRERLRAKYGVDPETMFGRAEDAARASGIPLDFSKVRRTPSTLPAHALLLGAGPRGTQHALLGALFEAYFLEGRDIGDAGVLGSIAARHGFDADEATALARDEQALDAARRASAEAAGRGVRGVPFFIFAGRLAVNGAQPVEVLRGAIERAAAEAQSG